MDLISLDTESLISLLFILASIGAFAWFISWRICAVLKQKKHPNAMLWGVVSFVLSFIIIIAILGSYLVFNFHG